MIHTLLSKSNGNVSSSVEKQARTVSANSSYIAASMEQRRSKRLKVSAVSEPPSNCGSVSTRLRSRTKQKEVGIEACGKTNVSYDCVPSCETDVELIHGENVGERDSLKSFDGKLCGDMDVGLTEGAGSHRLNMEEPMKVMVEAIEAQPVSICLPQKGGNSMCASKDLVVESVGKQSIVGIKQLRGRKVPVVKDFPLNTGINFSKSGKTVNVALPVEEKNLVPEKLDSGDHSCQSLAKSILPEDSELEKSKITVPKPIEAAGRRVTRNGGAIPSPYKVSKKKSRDHGEGSSKNSGTVVADKETLAQKPQESDVGLSPSRVSGSSSGNGARNKVKETLRLFYGACRKIIQEEEANPRERNGSKFRIDFEASKILKSEGKYLSADKQIMGPVPGVEVGDEFQYRMELNILGIHRPSQGGIDYMKDGNEIVATSIVSSGGYDDDLDNSDVVTYTGQGGNVMKGNKNNEPKDQQLVTGNLALANSKAKKNPVRVIRGKKKTGSALSDDSKNYVYDGLYLVEEFWDEIGSHGKRIYKFKLRRIPGQPELSWKLVKKSKKSESRDGLRCRDISGGEERFPICAVNELDDEEPPPFIYTAKMIYPDWCRPIPPKGCGCTKNCTKAKICACVAKNGKELPYNYDGAIVHAKDMVYECGPLCSCGPSCYLRVTQLGLKFQLEIFKTESRGWGVRSLSSIPSGSFICEYTGELLLDKEAERRTGEDEYLFDIGKKDKDGASGGFTIDAARKGNIGRFINHSCSPNLYAQDVLYDHEDTRIPHVMFFATDNIPPLQELSYHYNYTIDQVLDSDGNIKEKKCYCGASDCIRRLY